MIRPQHWRVGAPWLRNFFGPAVLVVVLGSACGPVPEPTTKDEPSADAGPSTPPAFPQPEGWDAQVALPLAEDLDPDPHTVHVELEAKLAQVELQPGVMTEMWTYNGQVPGPVIRVKKGDVLEVRLTNNLPEATTIHWHGLRVPAAMDGTEAMQNPILPGESFEYRFVVPDAGTYWYHPHYNSSAQVGFGLYAPLIVEDPEEPALGDDLVMVLSDVSLNDDGSLRPGDESGWFGDYFGREGGLLLVNGRAMPTILARPGVPQRWRVINASRARYQRFSVPGQSLIRVGGDAGLVENPQPVEDVILAPGERAELWLLPVAQPQGPVTVQWTDFNRFNAPAARPPKDLMVLEVTSDTPPDVLPVLPERLTTIEPVEVTDAHVQRVELGEKVVNGEAVLTINGSTHEEGGHSHLHALANSVEVWEVSNTTDYDHPFHLHGFFFQVLDIDGVPWPTGERKDTLNVRAGQTARLAVVFDDRPGSWMFHCHILDHAELGMMSMVIVE